MFMPWIWRAFEESWSLKGFVANLVSRNVESSQDSICSFNDDYEITYSFYLS